MNNRKLGLGAIMMIVLVSTIIGIGVTPILQQQSSGALLEGEEGLTRKCPCPKAPIATSGDNIYVAWWTNKTGNNNEVMFRASTDGGKTFGNKINLSNSTKSESQDAQIAASGDRVFVTWWERNATSNEPVLKVSTDNGKTFGSMLKLSANGTISSSGGG